MTDSYHDIYNPTDYFDQYLKNNKLLEELDNLTITESEVSENSGDDSDKLGNFMKPSGIIKTWFNTEGLFSPNCRKGADKHTFKQELTLWEPKIDKDMLSFFTDKVSSIIHMVKPTLGVLLKLLSKCTSMQSKVYIK
jgi:hypothetical protein